jgi:hypothetical protein
MGGDSSCFAPPIYYWSFQAQLIHGGTADDGYLLVFEEINDNCLAMLRIRDQARMASVIQTADSSSFSIYLSRVFTPSIQASHVNKLAVLAMHNDHWFYINDVLVCHCHIKRFSRSRLDVGIAASAGQTVVCHFSNFCVRVPSAAQRYPRLEELASNGLE